MIDYIRVPSYPCIQKFFSVIQEISPLDPKVCPAHIAGGLPFCQTCRRWSWEWRLPR